MPKIKFHADNWRYKWHPGAMKFPEFSRVGESVELTETLRALNWDRGERSIFDLTADEQRARFGGHIFTVSDDTESSNNEHDH